MEIRAKCEARELTLYLKGELDHHGAKGLIQQVEHEIEVALPGKTVLDFSGVTFMDSSGIAVVMRAKQRMRELGGKVAVRTVPAQPKKVFDAAGIDRMVSME